MTIQEGYKILKDSGEDYLDFDGPNEEGKYFVFVGKKTGEPFARFEDYDSADEFVTGVHGILNRVRSAGQLRSFFGR